MPDVITKITDVIVPEIFNKYLIQKTTKRNAFLNSGIASPDKTVDITRGGKTVNIPFWKRLNAQSEVLSDSNPLTLHKIDTDADIAVIHARGVAFAANELAALFSGGDPMEAIAVQLSDFWANEMTTILLSTLNGIFATTMTAAVNDQSTKVLTADMMADSLFLLGDNYATVTAVAMSSQVLAKLKKLDLVDLVQPSTISDSYMTYMDKKIIVDDALVPDATSGAYPIYFFGKDAIAYNENANLVSTREDTDILTGNDIIASRRAFTMHPRGVKWIGTPAGATPTNAELETGANWKLVEDTKNVAISKLVALVR